MTQISFVCFDIAEMSFALHGIDAGGNTVLKMDLKRARSSGSSLVSPPAALELR
jgi:hypothetical protein